ncbi:phosphoenolpyruvate synthase [Elysia marginata]|uniref:Phosphoenolpyruvate synthase n=1 Tax=Elysia marginata TaxID=1093978 RepID=A0AAV4HHA3_9GAST|nr:phosphoenolpyruvate synthase [Elysia marginata]
MCIQVAVFSQPKALAPATRGYVVYPNGDVSSVTDVEMHLGEMEDLIEEPPESWSFSFTADGKTYKVTAKTRGNTPMWYDSQDQRNEVYEVFTDFNVNSLFGQGVSEFFHRNSRGIAVEDTPPECPIVPEAPTDLAETKENEITLQFSDLACTASSLVGGKGAQLAQLTQIKDFVNAQVPPGFCLTLYSFQLQLQNILFVSASSDLSSLGRACEKAVQHITEADICEEVQTAILKSLKQVEGPEEDFQESHWAVRSSAAGEDGTEASSAGQMETILGVVGYEKILNAVKRCWASVYAHQAVEYRRQHGQPIRVLVGVVIQQMVPAEAAGVMFTADPVSGSNSVIVVNANFGLGESVVSGSSDPDTIHVIRDPEDLHNPDKLKLGSVTVGEKRTCLIEAENGGIKEETTAERASSVCLSEEMILKLATLGIELEKRFGSSRDVEWAVVRSNIFMLQCRPITVAESDTEYDFLHEFDSPLTCDYQWMTTSNIRFFFGILCFVLLLMYCLTSEMMPGALTPLTLSTFATSIDYSLQVFLYHVGARQRPTHLSKCLPNICNHLFIALIDVGSVVSHAMMANKDMMEISLLGSFLPEMTLQQLEDYAGKSVGFRRLHNFVNMLRMWSKAQSTCTAWEKKIPSYTVGPEAQTALELYKCIDQQLVDYETVWVWSLINSGRSGNMATVIMSIIGGDATGWTTQHYGDMALLLSQCNDVYSAEVPHAIENIARAVAEIGQEEVETFLLTPDEDCMEALSSHPKIMKMVEAFLARHGHRCLRESEMREKSWRSAPEKFISVLKLMIKTKGYEKNEKQQLSISELLDKMETKLPFLKRQILKFLLPKAWKAVGDREWGKSLSVQMNDVFKLAYQRLGSLLQQEGRLPDADLMYFLTHLEIGNLLRTGSARLIIKAQKRRKILAKQTSLKFEQMNKSRPFPTDPYLKHAEISDVECLTGMPVSQGQITGPAQVVHSLEGASVITPGDILVVKSTDVGWSPYFPLIGGLVTELGGLISHGAVVAREYGIPCVVNVNKATSIIQSAVLRSTYVDIETTLLISTNRGSVIVDPLPSDLQGPGSSPAAGTSVGLFLETGFIIFIIFSICFPDFHVRVVRHGAYA